MSVNRSVNPASKRPDIRLLSIKTDPPASPAFVNNAVCRIQAERARVNVKNLIFFVVGIAGAIAMAYFLSVRSRQGVVQPGALNLQDAAFWFFGIGLIGTCAWRALTGFSTADWHLPLWFAIGAFMIYAEVFNVVSMKEFACQVLLTRHHFVSPCYKTD